MGTKWLTKRKNDILPNASEVKGLYFQPEIETMEHKLIEQNQLEGSKRTAIYVYEHIPFYKNLFDEAGFDPYKIESFDDIANGPFTVKQDLRDNYPYAMFGMDPSDAIRVQASSGTTGQATVVGYTQKDIDNWGDCFARFLVAVGGSEKSKVQVSYGYGLFTGGLGGHEGARRLGAMCIPTSSGNTKRQVQIMKDFETDILCCTPSYALLIADTAIELGYNPAEEFKISGCVLGAEPWSNNMREEIERKLGVTAVDIYGLSEVMGPGVACECAKQTGLHVSEDHFYAEIVDPETLRPVEDGQWGELVITSLDRECSPLFRYRTRDITRFLPGECACGRTLKRIDRLQGRTDDMLIIRGVNVFPSQIEQVITHFDEVAPYYQIELSNKGPMDYVTLKVETVPGFDFDEIRRLEKLQADIKSELKSNLQIAVDVRIVEPKSIIRGEGKAKRVIDLRKDGE